MAPLTLTDLYGRYHATLVADARRYAVWTATDAEDLVMDLWASQPGPAPPGTDPLRWLRGCLRNHAVAARRRRGPHTRPLPLYLEVPEPAPDVPRETFPRPYRLAHCLGLLTRRQAQALELVYLRGCNSPAAAAILGITPPAVRRRTHYAISALTSCYAKG